jgi:NAD(P)-dependent dehydrogenase (short-subunit alcohol dehydrogenase family)
MKKVALITGGTRGIGFGVAKNLASTCHLAVNGIRAETEVEEAIDELKKSGNTVIYCRGDISNEDQRKSIVEKVRKHFGCLNILVNNAGVAPKQRKDLLETSPESFDYVLNTNLRGTFFLTQEVANWMVKQKEGNPDYEGSIINITSVSSTVASINRGEYCIAKAGLSMMSSLFSARLGEFNIPVYEVRPGVIYSDMTRGVKEKYDKLIAEGLTVQKRWGTPDDVGKAVSAIAAGGFPYSTGSVFMVDGGMTVYRL